MAKADAQECRPARPSRAGRANCIAASQPLAAVHFHREPTSPRQHDGKKSDSVLWRALADFRTVIGHSVQVRPGLQLQLRLRLWLRLPEYDLPASLRQLTQIAFDDQLGGTGWGCAAGQLTNIVYLSLHLSLSLYAWHCLSQFLWPFLTFLQFPIPICILLPLLLQFAFVAFLSPVCRGLKCRILAYTLHTLQKQRAWQSQPAGHYVYKENLFQFPNELL